MHTSRPARRCPWKKKKQQQQQQKKINNEIIDILTTNANFLKILFPAFAQKNGERNYQSYYRVISRHAFPARGLKNGKTTYFIKKKKKKKIQKSGHFQDISKISGTNVLRPDIYPGKKSSQFSNGNFRR